MRISKHSNITFLPMTATEWMLSICYLRQFSSGLHLVMVVWLFFGHKMGEMSTCVDHMLEHNHSSIPRILLYYDTTYMYVIMEYVEINRVYSEQDIES